MNQRSDHSKDERLNADPQDPRLSVHGLSEFVFCSRAGLCLHEQEHDLDESEGDADLSYLPIHEPERLRLVLQTLTRQFLWILGGGLTVFFLLAFAAWYSGRLVLWIAAGSALLLTVWGLYDRGYWVYRAQRQLELWQDAIPGLPNADSPKIQDIDWRSLLASERPSFGRRAHTTTRVGNWAASHGACWNTGTCGSRSLNIARRGKTFFHSTSSAWPLTATCWKFARELAVPTA